MPRKRTRRSRSLRHYPFIFSQFGRAIAQTASGKMIRHHIEDSKVHEECLAGSSQKGVVNHTSKGKEELSDSSESEFEGVVQADFAFFDPKPNNFHGVKVLLQTYLDNKQWDLSGFVDLILGQPTVGTIVKIENDDDEGIYGVISALNLARYKDHKCMTELKDFLHKKCTQKDISSNLTSLLEEQAQEVALLVSQRVVNLPPQLLPHLYDSLFDEVSWATEDEPTEELRHSFVFKYYLVVTKIYQHKSAVQTITQSKSEDEATIYIKPEDAIFHELSSWSFSYPLHSQQVTTNELKDYRSIGLVMAIEASRVPAFRQKLHSLIEE